MKTQATYTNDVLKLIISEPDTYQSAIESAFYQKEGDCYAKSFNGPFEYAPQIMKNFEHLAPMMFEQKGDWEEALLYIAETCQQHDIVWFLTGSACDAVRGIDICPHDLDIEIYSKHWKKSEKVFVNHMIEPYIETKGWVRENFGRLAIANLQIDMVADARFDLPNYDYEPYIWKGYRLWLEPFMVRYKTELERNRQDRIAKFESFFKANGIHI